MYAPPSAQRIREFRLRLHVSTFLMLSMAYDLWGVACMCLYFHNITAHAAEQFEHIDFKNQSCEAGEGAFAVENPILEAGCQRQEEVFDDMLLRLENEARVKKEHGIRVRTVDAVEGKIEERFRQHKWEEVSVLLDAESKALIKHLTELGYQGDSQGTDWQTCGTTISFNTCAAIKSYLGLE